MRIPTNHRAALSGVCKSGRQAEKIKKENSIERVFLFLSDRQTKESECFVGRKVDLRSTLDNCLKWLNLHFSGSLLQKVKLSAGVRLPNKFVSLK